VSEVEPAVLDALLSQLATLPEHLGAESAPNGDLAVRLTDDRGGASVFMMLMAWLYRSRSDQSSYSPNGTRNDPASLATWT
jgi:hypothetical protein